MALAAGQQATALGQCIGHMLFHLGHGLGVNQRALRDARLDAIAHLQLGHGSHQFFGKRVIHTVLHVQAVGAHASLARVAVFRGDGAFHGRIQVGVVEDDERRIAAQFQREFLDRRRALLGQQAAHLRRARKRQLAHDGVRGHFAADVFRRTGDDAEHARRHARALGQHGQRQRGKRCCFGRFQDHRAAGGQGRADFARDHGGGEIPRRDGGAHADRLFGDDQAAVRPRRLQGVARNALAFFGKPLDERGAELHFALRFRQGLALLGGHDQRQVVGVFQDQVMPAAQHGRAFLGRLLAPGGPGGIGRLDGAARLGCPHQGHRADMLAGGGIAHINRLATIGIRPGSIHVSLVTQQGRIFQLQHMDLRSGLNYRRGILCHSAADSAGSALNCPALYSTLKDDSFGSGAGYSSFMPCSVSSSSEATTRLRCVLEFDGTTYHGAWSASVSRIAVS